MSVNNDDLRELVLLARSAKVIVGIDTPAYLIPVARMEVFQRILKDHFDVDCEAPWEELRNRFNER